MGYGRDVNEIMPHVVHEFMAVVVDQQVVEKWYI